MRKMASIRVIKDLRPIPEADSIETALVDGWEVVVKKGDFQVGDYCVYIEIDSLLPDHPEFEFMRPRNMRVKTAKLRGQISQGLVMPMSIIPVSDWTLTGEGQDISELLGIVKYEPPVPSSQGGHTMGAFPGFVPKTDEERVQNLDKHLEKIHGLPCYVTEKLDGTSFTAYLHEGKFGVCSRNWEKQDHPNCLYWQIAHKYNIEQRMRDTGMDGFAIQGEIIGPGIQKNRYQLSEIVLFGFNVHNITKGMDADTHFLLQFFKSLNIQTVPFIQYPMVFEHMVSDLVDLSKGKSKLNPHIEREGIVVRSTRVNTWVQGIGRISFKSINPNYLLKYDNT